ncbi:uncharacterized protein LOC114730946 [Neltuma alba]|uniref:uncharacterized protein LOC114730946 n=1 Tax=Neltuma alba TaxID=207710 RepID=UPI0010A401F9|nr:uncharacterized protein LOC114730946 [Prosopis alba]
MSALIWNCQGAAKSSFYSVLKSFIKEHKPYLLVLVEPRISGEVASRAIKRIGLPNSHRVEASGFSGGIWVLWTDQIQVDILLSHWQFIHTRVHLPHTSRSFLFTAVYASPMNSVRIQLWSELSNLARSIFEPWAIAGDFNSVLYSSERRTSTGRRREGCPHFLQFVNDCTLLDLGFSGPRFTWRRGLSFARLDRVLVNHHWFDSYSNTLVYHLPKIQSDHRPLKLSSGLNTIAPKQTQQFRFLAPWLTHPQFSQLVRNNWSTDRSLHQNIEAFSRVAARWNREEFGAIGTKKRILAARISGVQKKLEESPLSHQLQKLNRDLCQEYESICLQEELLWIQKSRSDCINLGDRNTAYYHRKAKIRRSRNRITALKDGDGNWTYDEESLAKMVKEFYVNLYTAPETEPAVFRHRGMFPPLSNSSWDILNA